jgi:hypothetical protein
MNTKPQSKSKTFPKGTDYLEIEKFIDSQVSVEDEGCSITASKVLITIVRYQEKEVKEDKI